MKIETIRKPPSSGAASYPSALSARVTCVIVTHERPQLLKRCLEAVLSQACTPDNIVVVDNASGPATAAVLAEFESVEVLRLAFNSGGAGGFKVGIEHAMTQEVEFVWLMDDDGYPAEPACLETLIATASRELADITAPIVLDDADPSRLAFALRIRGRTYFQARDVDPKHDICGFAHLFNGALVRRSLIERIGLPDPRFVIRGDEVEFLYRTRKMGGKVRLTPRARFLHPGARAEIHSILFGFFHAVVPTSAMKRFHLFRNRAFIFRRYGMWGFLAADVIRYGSFFLLNRRGDVRGFAEWARATLTGLRGRFMEAS